MCHRAARVRADAPIVPGRAEATMAARASKALSFQALLMRLQDYWAKQGCVILQPYDVEMGAGTFHPATTLRALGPKTWNAAYVQPSRRPSEIGRASCRE